MSLTIDLNCFLISFRDFNKQNHEIHHKFEQILLKIKENQQIY